MADVELAHEVDDQENLLDALHDPQSVLARMIALLPSEARLDAAIRLDAEQE